jgi:hypothetical protein
VGLLPHGRLGLALCNHPSPCLNGKNLVTCRVMHAQLRALLAWITKLESTPQRNATAREEFCDS